MFCVNCRSINANWDPLNELICNMSSDRFYFDFIGLTEIFKLHDNFNYSVAGYHAIVSNTRHDTDDGHGGVGLYVNQNMTYFRRDDLSIFIPHVIGRLSRNQTKSTQINNRLVGVIYRPNTEPRADIDLFTEHRVRWGKAPPLRVDPSLTYLIISTSKKSYTYVTHYI